MHYLRTLLSFSILVLSHSGPTKTVAISLPRLFPNRLQKIRTKMGQTISTSQWYVYGRRHFTQSGYQRHIKDYYQALGGLQSSASIGRNVNGSDGVDLDGKVVVVTG